jgi:hypothetical protein
MKVTAAIAGCAILLSASAAQAIEFKPKLEAEWRRFNEAEGDGADLAAVAGTVETFHGWDDNRQRIVGELFARVDTNDTARTHGDVRELYYQVIGDDFEFRTGARRVYWGVTESRHLVDIINQSDFVENIDNEDKLGQPMMNLALIRELGTIDLFLMPYQRARTFPGPEGYPKLPLPVHAWDALYQSRREQTHLDYALRYVNAFGPVDLGVAWFDGTARDPRLLPCLRRDASGTFVQGSPDGPTCDIEDGILVPGSPFPDEVVPLAQALGVAPANDAVEQAIIDDIRRNLVLIPYYDRLRQVSVDAQIVFGSMAVKLEALRREQQGNATWAGVSGFEYTFGDVWGTGADVGVLGEYLYDEKEDFLNVLVDDEVFAGSRLAFNDVAGVQLLAGVIASRDDFKSLRYGLEASGRLGDDWKLSLEARIFSELPQGSTEALLEDQDFVTVTLERFF